jgi:hypothetical protein
VVWRRVDVRDDLDLAGVLVERGAGRPGVLTDGEADRRVREADRAAFRPRHEVPLLVEHPVVRQLELVVAGLDAATSQERGGVVQLLLRAVDEPRQHGTAICGSSRELLECREVAAHERAAEHEVLGRVAGDRELGEADEVRAVPRCLACAQNHLLDVAVEVADREVQLPQRDAHLFSVAPTGAGLA